MSKKQVAEKGDMIRLTSDDQFYTEHSFPDKDKAYKVTASEFHGVFIKEYKYMIPHSDYQITQ